MRHIRVVSLFVITLAAGCATTAEAQEAATRIESEAEPIDQSVVDQYASMGVRLTLPEEYYTVPHVQQFDARYDIAFMLPGRNIEYRLAVYPPSFIDLGDGWSLEQTLALILLLPTAFNISQDQSVDPGFKPFPEEAVRREFGADVGITGVVPGNSGFSAGWNYVMIEGFIKADTGVVMKYTLFDDPEELVAGIMGDDKLAYQAYYCFRFEDCALRPPDAPGRPALDPTEQQVFREARDLFSRAELDQALRLIERLWADPDNRNDTELNRFREELLDAIRRGG